MIAFMIIACIHLLVLDVECLLQGRLQEVHDLRVVEVVADALHDLAAGVERREALGMRSGLVAQQGGCWFVS